MVWGQVHLHLLLWLPSNIPRSLRGGMAAVRPRRVVECGLEVPRGVVYQGWEPGGEYTKTLVVKNVQLRTQRIKYT